jgi:hypothetical protein
MIFSTPPEQALTTCDLVAWPGVRLGALHFMADFPIIDLEEVASDL